MDGRPLDHVDVKAMEEAGVFLVTQEPMIIDNMTAAENLMLGIWPVQGGFVDWKKLRADAARPGARFCPEPVQAGRTARPHHGTFLPQDIRQPAAKLLCLPGRDRRPDQRPC